MLERDKSKLSQDIDTTVYRRKVWDKEYAGRNNLPSTKATADHPSRAFRIALEEIPEIKRGKLLDLGAGNFRNSIWAVKEAGFENAVGVEFSDSGVRLGNKAITANSLEAKIKVLHQSVGEKIDYLDESFDVAIDMMVMHSLNLDDRKAMANELQRLLKPDGYFVFYTIAGLMEFENEKTAFGNLVERNPGPEAGSYRFQVDNDWITEKGFTKEEIESLFPEFELLTLEPRVEFTPAFGDVFKRVYYYGVMRK